MPTALRQQAYPFGSLRKDPHWSVQGLVLYPNFRPAGVLRDESPYGNDGTVTGAKWVGEGLRFNGSSDSGQLPAFIGGFTQLTVILEVKASRLSSGDDLLMESSINYNSNNAFIIDMIEAETIAFAVQNEVEINYNQWTTSSTLDVGVWTQLAFTCDTNAGTAAVIGYVNGKQDGSRTISDNLEGMTFDNDIIYLATRAGSSLHWGGDMRDIKIYNRVLSASEIAALSLNPALPMQQPPIWLFKAPAVIGTTPKGPLGHPLYGPFAGPIAC